MRATNGLMRGCARELSLKRLSLKSKKRRFPFNPFPLRLKKRFPWTVSFCAESSRLKTKESLSWNSLLMVLKANLLSSFDPQDYPQVVDSKAWIEPKGDRKRTKGS